MKFFNKWLTAAEEEALKSPSRRVFCIGALSTLCLAAAPDGFHKVGNLFVPDETIWTPGMQINWMGVPGHVPAGLYETLINDIKRHAAHLVEVGPEHFRVRWEQDQFHKGDYHILIVETDVPEPKTEKREVGLFAGKAVSLPRKHDIKAIYNAPYPARSSAWNRVHEERRSQELARSRHRTTWLNLSGERNL